MPTPDLPVFNGRSRGRFNGRGGPFNRNGHTTPSSSVPADASFFAANHYDALHNAVASIPGGTLGYVCRAQIQIGSGPRTYLKFELNNHYLDVAGQHNTGNSITVTKIAIERGASYAPILYSGNASILLADGDSEILSGVIAASSFGLSEFPQDDPGWLRIELLLSGAGSIPVSRGTVEKTGSQSYRYDPNTVTLTNGTYSTGLYTFSPDTKTAVKFMFTALTYGVASGAAQETYIYTGDSHSEGEVLTASQYVYDGKPGFVVNGLIDSDGVSNARACIKVGAGGTAWADFIGLNVKWQHVTRRATHGVCPLGGNPDAGGTANWTTLRGIMTSGGVQKIIAFPVFPQATSSDLYHTATNQTAYTGYNANIVAYNAFFLAQFNAGNIDYYDLIYGAFAVDDVTKWTYDGTDYFAIVNDATGAPTPPLHMKPSLNGLTGLATANFRAMAAVIHAGGPVLRSQSMGSLTTTGGTLTVTPAQANGTIYAVVVPANDPVPSDAQIKAGLRQGGGAASATGNVAVASLTAKTIVFVGLALGTTYITFAYHEAAAGDSTSVRADFSTNSGIATVQGWADFTGTGTTIPAAFGSAPIAGNLLCVFAGVFSPTKTLSIADDWSDGVAWIPASYNPNTATGARQYFWWKVMGTGNGNKTIAITDSVTGTEVDVNIAEYQKSDPAKTWTAEGTWLGNSNAASTNPDPGAIVGITGNVNVLVMGYVGIAVQTPAAGTNYTLQGGVSSRTLKYAVEDRIVALSATSYDPLWAAASAAWIACGAAISAK